MDSRRLGFVLGVVLGLCPSVAMQADGSEDEKPLYKDATAPVVMSINVDALPVVQIALKGTDLARRRRCGPCAGRDWLGDLLRPGSRPAQRLPAQGR